MTVAFSVRPATETERRRLVGVLFPPPAAANTDVVLAVEGEGEPWVGAAAASYKPSRIFANHGECVVFVKEGHRRSGIGRALIRGLTDAALKCGAQQLRSRPMEQSSASFQFAIACGFQAKPATITYEAPMKDYVKAFAPIYERIVERGRMPSGARMIALKDANREEVCRFIIDNLGFPADGVAERLRGTEHGYSQTLSRVALLDGKMVGAILGTYHGAMAMIQGTAVLPNHRNSWVNSALKYHIMQALISRGVEWVRFSANESEHRDTANFGRRLKARILSRVSTAVFELKPQL